MRVFNRGNNRHRRWDGGAVTWIRPYPKHNELTKWNWMVSFPSRLSIGKNVDIGAFTYIQAEYCVEIGHDVQIGGGCMVYSKNTENDTVGMVKIGPSARIGAQSLILPGSHIPEGSRIKAHSIVMNKDGETVVYEPQHSIRVAG